MSPEEKKKYKIAFKAGMKCQEMHPDDDTYDKVHFEEALKKIKKVKQKK